MTMNWMNPINHFVIDTDVFQTNHTLQGDNGWHDCILKVLYGYFTWSISIYTELNSWIKLLTPIFKF